MTAALWMQHLRLTAQVATLALAAMTLFAASPAVAQTQEDDEEYNHVLNTDKRILDTILGTLGLKSSSGDIEYRERSPLVVPPARDLPPPEANAASKNPQWPVDPEVKEKKQAAVRKRGQPDVDPAKPVGPVELARGTGKPTATDDSYDPNKPALMNEPGFFKRLFNGGFSGSVKDEVGTFTGEPPRVTLTAPPPGYLTPSPAAPYGVTKRDDPNAYKKVEK